MRPISRALLVRYYTWLLGVYGRLLPPECVVSDAKLQKDSVAYRWYTDLIGRYADTLQKIRKRGPGFGRALQEYRLGRMLHTAEYIPWWQQRMRKAGVSATDISAMSQLSRIPPIQRPELVSVPLTSLSRPFADAARVQRNATSGSTTGTPFFILFKKSIALANVTAHYVRTLKDHGYPYERMAGKDFLFHVNLFGLATRLTTAPEQFGHSIKIRAQSPDLRDTVVAMCKQMEEVGNCVLFTHPSELPLIIQKLAEYDLHPPITLCLVIGQMLEKEVREYVEQYLGCKVISMFGMREFMLIGTSCPEHPDFFHVHQERAVMEILTEGGTEAEEGEFGALTITGLDNELMPLIRYQSGDQARFCTDTVCSCVNQSPLYELESRTTDVLYFEQGVTKPVRKILKTFGLEPFVSQIRRFQVVQDTPEQVTVRIEGRYSPLAPTIIPRLERIIRSYDLIPSGVTLLITEEISIDNDPAKFKVFVPLRPIPS